jgi:hypothetical protein
MIARIVVMRSYLPIALAAASLSLFSFACSAPAADDGAATGDEANLTERKIVSHTSWVSGKQSFSQDEAKASVAAACAAVGANEKAIAGARYLDVQCGEPQNLLSSGGYLFAAQATTRFVVDVEQGTSPAMSPTTTIYGAQNFSQSEALDDAATKCAAELKRVQSLFGDRLLGGGCDAPKNMLSSGGYLFAAQFSAFVLPTVGASAKMPVSIRAAAQSFSESEALDSWQAACAAAGAATGAPADKLVSMDCGAPKNLLSSGGYIFGSTGSFEVASGAKEVIPTTGAGANVFGTQSFSQAEALASWQAACTASLALAKDVASDGYLGGACSEPKNLLSSGGYLYASAAPFVALPGGATRITIPGYALGTQSFSQSDALASFTTAEAASFRGMSGGHAGAKVESFQSEPAANTLTSGGYRYAAKTELVISLDVADGALPPQQVSSRVSGQSSFSQDTAAASWAKACDDAIAAAKANYGDRYIGGACQAPAYASQVYSSDLVVWFLP